MKRRTLRITISLFLAVALLAVFLWNTDLGKVAQSLAEANPAWLAAAVVAALFSYWLRAVRWQFILRPVGRVRHSSVVLTIAVGYMLMAVLPARIGDLVRPVLLARRERISVSGSLASILTERIFDLWTVVAFFLVFIVWPPAMEIGEDARANLDLLNLSGLVVGAGLAVGTLVLLGLFRFQERFVQFLTAPIARFNQRWSELGANFLNHFLDGLRILARPRDLLLTVASSALLWYVIYWQVKFSLLAFGVYMPLRGSFLLVTLTVIGLAIPTPAGMGGFHKAFQLGLVMFFAVELNLATAITFAYHAICFLPITLIGFLCLPALGLSLREIDTMTTDEAKAKS